MIDDVYIKETMVILKFLNDFLAIIDSEKSGN